MKDSHTPCSRDHSTESPAARGSKWAQAFETLLAVDNTSLKSAQQSMAALVDGVVRTNVRATQEMLDATTPSRLAELQQQFIRDYMKALVDGTITLVQAIQETAERAPRRDV